MEKETLLQSFGTFLKRRHYRMRIVPLHQMMGKGKPWNAVPVLQVFDALYGDYGVILDWNGYETEQYVDLWHLGIVQFAYAGLHHGVFCEDGKALGSLFSAFFPAASVKPLHPSKPLRVMALRQNEKNDLQDGDSGNLILDIFFRPKTNALHRPCVRGSEMLYGLLRAFRINHISLCLCGNGECQERQGQCLFHK